MKTEKIVYRWFGHGQVWETEGELRADGSVWVSSPRIPFSTPDGKARMMLHYADKETEHGERVLSYRIGEIVSDGGSK